MLYTSNEKILQMLKSNKRDIVSQGIRILKDEKNPDSLIYFLSRKSYVSGMILYDLVPYYFKINYNEITGDKNVKK